MDSKRERKTTGNTDFKHLLWLWPVLVTTDTTDVFTERILNPD